MMLNHKIFKTKTGYCHILPDKIVLTRTEVVGEISTIIVGNGIQRILIIYMLISISLLYFAFNSFTNGEMVIAAFYALIAVYLIYGITKSLNNSATPIIDRAKIKNVKFHAAKVGRTRAYFEVLFENENGKLKNRLIMLPGSLNDGKEEAEKALSIMMEENLITKDL